MFWGYSDVAACLQQRVQLSYAIEPPSEDERSSLLSQQLSDGDISPEGLRKWTHKTAVGNWCPAGLA